MMTQLDDFRRKQREFGFASCALITGESGSGKSYLAKHYLKKNPPIITDTQTIQPVIHVELKAVSTPRHCLSLLLQAVNDPQMGEHGTQAHLHDRLMRLLKTTQNELLIIDEIQVIFEDRSKQVLSGIADVFKDIIKDSGVCVVLQGMPWSKYLLDSNTQLKERVPYRWTMPTYLISNQERFNDYRRLLVSLTNAHNLSTSLDFKSVEVSRRFFAATAGNLRRTANIFIEASIASIQENRAVDLELLAKVIKAYGTDDQNNAFALPMENLVFEELVDHSDWKVGARSGGSRFIAPVYTKYVFDKQNRLRLINSA